MVIASKPVNIRPWTVASEHASCGGTMTRATRAPERRSNRCTEARVASDHLPIKAYLNLEQVRGPQHLEAA